ncbi:MAG TPA: hypothetical protein VFR68_02610 [Candidatus Dormibacteraeota bacterium]|nr:hypothetical protein [Candidatus Dormibacteraeota bacterium]
MSRRLKRQLGKAQGGRGAVASPTRRVRTPEERVNRILLIGGSGLALGAVAISLSAPHFDPLGLGVRLAAVAVGLLMGKGIGRVVFRRDSPRTGKPVILTNRGK